MVKLGISILKNKINTVKVRNKYFNMLCNRLNNRTLLIVGLPGKAFFISFIKSTN